MFPELFSEDVEGEKTTPETSTPHNFRTVRRIGTGFAAFESARRSLRDRPTRFSIFRDGRGEKGTKVCKFFAAIAKNPDESRGFLRCSATAWFFLFDLPQNLEFYVCAFSSDGLRKKSPKTSRNLRISKTVRRSENYLRLKSRYFREGVSNPGARADRARRDFSPCRPCVRFDGFTAITFKRAAGRLSHRYTFSSRTASSMRRRNVRFDSVYRGCAGGSNF